MPLTQGLPGVTPGSCAGKSASAVVRGDCRRAGARRVVLDRVGPGPDVVAAQHHVRAAVAVVVWPVV
ncbi:hypothetical protein QJS66_15790 [Kocuria rhizophila]|nr:hypothetical protein QJS66_15790 [Kocuria rhizophila]